MSASIDSSRKRQQPPTSASNYEDGGGILLSTVQSAKRPHHDHRKRQKQYHNLSALETLLSELLEKIFLYSITVNFVRASPFLAAAVSSERLYRLLILLAFWDGSEVDHSHDWENRVSDKGVGPYQASTAYFMWIGTAHLFRREGIDRPWVGEQRDGWGRV